jgi:hypothetical protein
MTSWVKRVLFSWYSCSAWLTSNSIYSCVVASTTSETLRISFEHLFIFIHQAALRDLEAHFIDVAGERVHRPADDFQL